MRKLREVIFTTHFSLFVRPCSLLLIRCELADDDDDAACNGRHKVILGRFILNPPKTSSSALALANQPLGNGRAGGRGGRGEEQGLNKQGKKFGSLLLILQILG